LAGGRTQPDTRRQQQTTACALGTLYPGAPVTITVSAALGTPGTATDVASVNAPATDPVPANNQVSILASVLIPAALTTTVAAPTHLDRTDIALPASRRRAGTATLVMRRAGRVGACIDRQARLVERVAAIAFDVLAPLD
jgi:hypothetical protein